MHNVLFILSYAHVAGCFNKCRNKQSTVFIQSNLLICPTLQDGMLKPT